MSTYTLAIFEPTLSYTTEMAKIYLLQDVYFQYIWNKILIFSSYLKRFISIRLKYLRHDFNRQSLIYGSVAELIIAIIYFNISSSVSMWTTQGRNIAVRMFWKGRAIFEWKVMKWMFLDSFVLREISVFILRSPSWLIFFFAILSRVIWKLLSFSNMPHYDSLKSFQVIIKGKIHDAKNVSTLSHFFIHDYINK